MRKYDRFQYILQDLHQLSWEQLVTVINLIDFFLLKDNNNGDVPFTYQSDNDDYPF